MIYQKVSGSEKRKKKKKIK